MTDDTDETPQSPFTEVPIEITVSVGQVRPTVQELLGLTHDSVLTLDRGIDDPVELYVGDRLIARGELQESEDDNSALLVRIVDVVAPDRR